VSDTETKESYDGIAIVGMSGRFPGAGSIEEFWRNLKDGVESVSYFSDSELKSAGVPSALISNPSYVRAKAVLDGVEGFDAWFFGFTPREAEITDPQHRLLLECAWEALERAGYDPERYTGLIGIYAGAGINTYLLRNLSSDRDLIDSMSAFQTSIHNKNDHLTTRVAYLLNLRGPSVTVQTACSTSLVAVCLASHSLLNYQCDMALAGGVCITLPQQSGYLYQEGGIGSPDGHCRAFDAKAGGTMDGNGAGIVVLKRLTDALADCDTIHAVIRGVAVNNDGSHKAGYTAPGMDAQADVIAMAQAMAGFEPDSISYVEAHGTATPLGDPIEIAALTKAFRLGTDRRGFCAVGSVKTNIGHLDAAAGVAGLIKTVLALENRLIPPSLHFEQSNPRIDFGSTAFYVNSRLSEWKRGVTPRRAGVSSFGIGGTNAHVVLEEAPESSSSESTKPWHLLLLSGKSSAALETQSDNLAAFLERDADLNLADVAYTLQIGRGVFNHRRAVLCRDRQDAVRSLRSLDYERVASRFQEPVHRPVTFMFPGQGTQYPSMAGELYRSEPIFRQNVDLCAELLKPHLGSDLRELLYPSEEERERASQQLDQTAFTQPALFVIEYALAKLWTEWGVHPAAMIGHSIGEYVAATLAGVMSLEDSVALVAFRGRLIQSLPSGSMLAVTMPERDILPLLDEHLSLAAVNGPSLCVVSGPAQAVDELEKRVTRAGVIVRHLRASHAFHSKMMKPVSEALRERFKQVRLHPPEIPYISNLTGTWIRPIEATDPNYWAMHLCQTVRFADGVAELLKEPEAVLLEVGPGRTLKTVSRWHPAKSPAQVMETSLPHRDERQSDFASLLSSVGKLWLAGVEIDWPRFYANERRLRIRLPTYPFERRRYWIEDRSNADAARPLGYSLTRRTDIADWFYVPVWKESVMPDLDDAQFRSQQKSWLLFSNGDSVSKRLARRLEELDQEVSTVTAGHHFEKSGKRSYQINPAQRQDYVAVLEDLQRGDGFPDSIVHLWSMTPADAGGQSSETIQRLGFYSLLLIAQAIGEQHHIAPLQLTVVSNALQEVTGEEVIFPEKATVLGPCKVIPREYPHVSCRSLDITFPERATWQEDKLVDHVITEAAGQRTDPVVAIRRSHRWVQHFEQARLERGVEEPPLLRERGVYLITGGLGGIGLALGDHLARAVRARVVLCGRSQFPGKNTWDQWLEEHDEENTTSEKIRKIRRLEEAGADVMITSAEVANEEHMRELIARVVERFGQINGVIHAAGIAGGGLMQLRSPEEAARVLAPKVEGTRVLESVCNGLTLDFLVFCSSLGSLVGSPGQVDYCAANAFLDAFAREQHRRNGAFTVSINWGEWQGVGMAAGESLGGREDIAQTRRLNHPLLEKSISKASGEEVYITDFNVNTHWVLDEHRLVGNAVIPGVAYFEMVRAALGERARNKVIELHDVYFVGPLPVRDDQTREVRLVFQPDAEGLSFSVESDPVDEEIDVGVIGTYALGKVRLSDPVYRSRYKIDELIAICNVREEVFAEEEREDDLGPRWQNIKKAYIGPAEVLTVLELPEGFAADFDQMKYHPALMDRAVGRAKEYLVEGEYLPVSYKSVKIHSPIPPKIYSYARYQASDDTLKETLTWNTVVLDESGLVLVEIEGFVQKRINDAATTIKSHASTNMHRRPALKGAPDQPVSLRRVTRDEMQLAEGVEAFRRILAHRVAPQVAVSVRDLNASIKQADLVTQERIQEEAEKPRAPKAAHPRPNLRTKYEPPGNESERRLAAIWAETLGIEQVGIHDNFFELGGDSVQAILIIASLNRAGVQLTPQQFFQFQTIAELAETIGATSLSRSVVSSEHAGDANLVNALSRDEETSTAADSDFPLANLDEDQLTILSALIADADEETTPPEPVAFGSGEGIQIVGAFESTRASTVAKSFDEGLHKTGKIEVVLRQHPAVRDAVVIAQGAAADGDDRDYVAYVVLDRNGGYARSRPMEFSVFYFADDKRDLSKDKYRLFLDGARFADEHNFSAVWTPERHFHSSGGLYPSPSVLSAALATVTRNVRLRAGSVVLPLHHPLRVAEEWAVVDNLSEGRVDISFTSGWIPNDFVFFPDRFASKRSEMFDGIEHVKRLWRGESMRVKDGAGNDVEVKIFPRPIQAELPVWLTCSGDPQMFVKAGELGVNLLTALLTQSVEETAAKIALYRGALARNGHGPESGHVTLMIHTFVGADDDSVLEKVRGPLRHYLRSHVGLVETMVKSLNLDAELKVEKHLDDLVSFAFERYYQTASLIGTPDRCLRMIERLRAIGVDEVACFIDFGVDVEAVMGSLPHLNALKNLSQNSTGQHESPELISGLLSSHVRERLPDEMVPSVFLTLDNLPLNSDGTIDRQTLRSQGDSRLRR
jgi:phthiocerol/phenolphthiocerol synthesis type-I polyketide synthase E